MENFHIAISCPNCGGAGSVASVACHQAKELARYFQVTLISDTLPQKLFNGINCAKISPRQFDYLHRYCHVPNEYSFVKSVRRQLYKIHQNDPISMIMCHSHALATLAATYFKRRYQIPYALIAHGNIFNRPQGTYDWRLTQFYRAVTPCAYRNANLVVALSPYMAHGAIKKGAVPEAVHIVPNGIEPSDIGINIQKTLLKEDNFLHNKRVDLLFVGGLTKIKGVKQLVQAGNILKERGVKYKMRIVGEGHLGDELRHDIERFDLSSQITLQGVVKRHLLGKYYRNTDIVCVPSLDDPLPTVVLEALVSGKPVIASDTGGIPFMIKNGFNGILIPLGKPDALADAIESLYKNPVKLSQLANNALNSVYPRFSWLNIGKQLRKLIIQTCADQKASNFTSL